MSKCCPVTKLSKALVIIGGLNWGLVGAANFDLVQYLFTDLLSLPVVAKIVYILVGLAAVFMLAKCLGGCKGGSCSVKK